MESREEFVELAPGVLVTSQGSLMVLMHPKTGKFYGVNHTAAILLRAIEEGQPISVAIERIVSLVGTDNALTVSEVEQDVCDLVEQLIAAELAFRPRERASS